MDKIILYTISIQNVIMTQNTIIALVRFGKTMEMD